MKQFLPAFALLGSSQAGCPLGLTGPPPILPRVDTTGLGCECISVCGATGITTPISQGAAACDWCWTKDGCGQYGWRGSWDWCVYPSMQDFLAQSHEQKLAQLWDDLTAPDVVGKSGTIMGPMENEKVALSESMITTFDNQRDVFPAGRLKAIHPQGVVCQVELDVNSNSKYTGIFAPGKSTGLMRLGNANSLAGPSLSGSGTPSFPGMGVKFTRTGQRSADFVMLRATGPGGEWNYFDSDFSNHLPPPDKLVKLHKFQQATGCMSMVGLSDVCTYSQSGEKASAPNFPFEVLFTPSQVNFSDTKTTDEQLLVQLSGMAVGSQIFTVYTYASPLDKLHGVKTPLGSIKTVSQCHQSLFGDHSLFFRHTRMEEDFALRPNWIDQMNVLRDPTCPATPGPVSNWQCTPAPKDPLAWLKRESAVRMGGRAVEEEEEVIV